MGSCEAGSDQGDPGAGDSEAMGVGGGAKGLGVALVVLEPAGGRAIQVGAKQGVPVGDDSAVGFEMELHAIGGAVGAKGLDLSLG